MNSTDFEKRQEANSEICRKLLEWFQLPENKDQRFFQGLTNLGIITFDQNNIIIDKYNEEPTKTLQNLLIK